MNSRAVTARAGAPQRIAKVLHFPTQRITRLCIVFFCGAFLAAHLEPGFGGMVVVRFPDGARYSVRREDINIIEDIVDCVPACDRLGCKFRTDECLLDK